MNKSLAKVLIRNFLCFSSLILPFTLANCSNKIKFHDGDEEIQEINNHMYVFNIKPKLVDINGKEQENSDDIVSCSSSNNWLTLNPHFNENFLNELDSTREKPIFVNDNGASITSSLGTLHVYYLNAQSKNIGDEIIFYINEEIFNKNTEVDDFNDLIRLRGFERKVKNNNGGKNLNQLIVKDAKHYGVKLSFEDKEDDGKLSPENIEALQIIKEFKKMDEGNNNKLPTENIKKIKKVKFRFKKEKIKSLCENGFGGWLLTFRPIPNQKATTVVIKFVNNEEYKFFADENFYKQDIFKNYKKNYFITLNKIGEESVKSFLEQQIKNDKSIDPDMKKWLTDGKIDENKFNQSKEKNIKKLNKYLKQYACEWNENFDSWKVKDPTSFLLKKINNKECSYNLYMKCDEIDKMGLNLALGASSHGENDYYVHTINYEDFRDEREISLSFTISYQWFIDLLEDNIKVKFKDE